ncbi:cytochrome d ubiquinol oxidase subunit II [bacterium]|nr:cytochrome d ubiquinol oxidase subunit II [bacterium]
MDLNTIWYLLIGILIAGYAVLDGFDLGVGVLHLTARNDKERRIFLNSIGPVWDGNEVWLLTAGGALFAAFPVVYATVFSDFYIAFMLLLAALIFRAVSLEFRGKSESPRWRSFWDWGFNIGSTLPAILYGVAVGNILRGVPINRELMWTGSFIGLLNPFSILTGILTLSLFTMHGAIYLSMKTDGDLRKRVCVWIIRAWTALVILYVTATFSAIFTAKYLFEGLFGNPLFWIFFILLLGGIIYIPISVKSQKYFRAFISSSLTIICMIGLAAVSMFPKLTPSITDLSYSLTIYNASSTPRTLTVMLIIALIGMPIVIGYSVFIYKVFKGKVEIAEESY